MIVMWAGTGQSRPARTYAGRVRASADTSPGSAKERGMADAQEAEARTRALSRRQFLHAAALVGGAAALGACQGSAPAAPPTTSQPTSAAGGAAEWEQQWNALVEAARRERTVVFSGP